MNRMAWFTRNTVGDTATVVASNDQGTDIISTHGGNGVEIHVRGKKPVIVSEWTTVAEAKKLIEKAKGK